MKKRTKEEEIDKDEYGPPTQKVSKILLDLNQAVHNHLADEESNALAGYTTGPSSRPNDAPSPAQPLIHWVQVSDRRWRKMTKSKISGSHEIATQPSHSVDRARQQANIEFRIP